MNEQTERTNQQKTETLNIIEHTLAYVALDYANGEGLHKYAGFYDTAANDPWDQITDHYEQWARDEIIAAFGELPAGLMFNWDPRGHMLKIDCDHPNAANYRHDWGGYGLLAPDAYDEKHGGSI